MKHYSHLLFGICLAVGMHLQAQELPQGYFRNPLDGEINLSATFAEFRPNHFHGGIDMRTGGVEGLPVHAAADGYVSRVKISEWGGGKILYINHSNGFTSVYMHLSAFSGNIGKAVLDEQYANHSYTIDKTFDKDELPVKKGQIVAFTGNTGGSAGPHLHFELRETATDRTFNPLLFGLPYRDSMKPVIRGLRLYPANGGEPVILNHMVSASSVEISSPFYLGVFATDAAEGSTPNNGTDHVEITLDGKPFFCYNTRAFLPDSTRAMNALLDMPQFTDSKEPYLITRGLPGANGEWITLRDGDGIFRFAEGSSHTITVKVYDVKNNFTEHNILVTCVRDTIPHADSTAINKPGNTYFVNYRLPQRIQQGNYTIILPQGTFYANESMRVSVTESYTGGIAPVCTIMPTINPIPPHREYTIIVKPSISYGSTSSKVVLVRNNGTKHTAYATTYREGHFVAQVRDFGQFTLMADVKEPQVKPINFGSNKRLKTNTLKIKITDNLSGIASYHCYLNGTWILAEYDAKKHTLIVDAAGKLKSGNNELRVEVSDAVGNTARQTFTLVK